MTATDPSTECLPDATRVVLAAEDTGGTVSVVEFRGTSADPPPMRRCSRDGVVWTVVEGGATLVLDGRRRELRPGEAAFVPAGVPHGWVGDPPGSRLLAVVVAGPAAGPERHPPVPHFSWEELDVFDDAH